MPSPCPLGHLDPTQLCRARLRLCWDLLTQAAEHLDVLPLAARAPLAQALAQLALANAAVEETTTSREKESNHDASP
jgi:hypothetical protein